MSTETDPLDELFSQPAKARGGGKFPRKVKPLPRKETSIKLHSPQPVENIKNADIEIKRPSENNLSSQIDVVPDIPEKPFGEEASTNTAVDQLDEIFSRHVAKNARGGAKFPPKTKPLPRKETSIKQPSLQPVNKVAENETNKTSENKSDENIEVAQENADTVVGLESLDDVSHETASTAGSAMSTEIDPLDELFTQTTKARGGGKFPPKVKPRPSKETSIKVPVPQPVEIIKNTDSELKRPSDDNIDPQTDIVLLDTPGNPFGEEASTNTSVDPWDEIFSDHVAKNARAGAKFPPKTKPLPRKKTSIKQPSSSQPVNKVAGNETKKTSENKPNNNLELAQENADTVVGLKSLDDVSHQTTGTRGGPPVPDVLTSEEPVSSVQTCLEDRTNTSPRDEQVVLDPDLGFHFNEGVLEIEEIETGPSTGGLECLFHTITQSGQRSQKIQPTVKSHADTRKNDVVPPHPDESEFVPCFDNDDNISDFMPSEDLTCPAETLEKSSELREGKTLMMCDESLGNQEAPVSVKDNAAGISIPKLRKCTGTYALVDENEDEPDDVGNLGNEHPCGTPMEEDNCSDGVTEVENKTQKGKPSKKSRKASSQKEKPVRKSKKVNEAPDEETQKPRKRKKVNEAPDKETQKPRKKFSHSTRRNKRQVDKVLLETPEDDIDTKRIRIRDLILLGEHREKAASKKGKTTEPPSADKSAGTSFSEYDDDYIEGEDFASEKGQCSNDQPESSNYFNYHSYMKKTPRSRWSKQDTELFYQGVRQFGSDISMIQQLFPDRTRAQVKLKYKKEERRQPLMLHDALTSRSEDNSHFKRVIEQLKQLAAQENKNSFEDDSVDLTGNGEDDNPEINEQVGDLDKEEEREDKEMEHDPSEAHSPVKSFYDSDDDLSTWCQYKSEL